MGLKIPVRRKSYEAYKPSQYLAITVDIVPTDPPPKERETGKLLDYWTFIFRFAEGEYMGKTISSNVPAKITPKSKLNGWLNAYGINAVEEYVDKDFDSDAVKGKHINIIVENKVSGDDTFSNVTGLAPLLDSQKKTLAEKKVAPVAAPVAAAPKPAAEAVVQKDVVPEPKKEEPKPEPKKISADQIPF